MKCEEFKFDFTPVYLELEVRWDCVPPTPLPKYHLRGLTL